ncbi:VRR-NUC domain containing protein [uncultured Caudovirales phage]|uniref:VRR-NUC domain containing protein n=1 Tax=uncultured Caudovirales phage TaxID=2100421 RepID=A0A6J5RVM4_9CAUD|nr:VRR-NUC domain containing protein [uncultured Caudovirales phage]
MTVDRIPTEHEEQRELVRWFRQTYKGVRIFAIPNGGARSPATAGRLKAEGVSSGVPDLFIPAWKLWIEMKRTKGGSLSAEQKDWIAYLESVRFWCIVGKGADDAKVQIQAFFNEGKFIP